MTLKWGYKRAFLRCALLFVVGTTLQLAIGDIDSSWLRYPWGLILAVNYLYLLVVAYVLRDRWRWLRQLADDKACISSLASLGVMVIIFGLTRQDPLREGWVGAMGFSRMRASQGRRIDPSWSIRTACGGSLRLRRYGAVYGDCASGYARKYRP